MAKDDVKKKAAELIRSNRYSKLITFGTDGAPHGRIMTNLPLGNDMVIWFATGLSTSKIKDIKKNPTVSVFVDDPTNQKNASMQQSLRTTPQTLQGLIPPHPLEPEAPPPT